MTIIPPYSPFQPRDREQIYAEDIDDPEIAKVLGLPSRSEIKAQGSKHPLSDPSDDAIGLQLKRGDKIVEREQSFLVLDFLPTGTLTLVAGKPGIGKTTACLSLAADITRGRVPIVGGKREAGNVLFLSDEDDESSLRRNFSRLGGDLKRFYVKNEDSGITWGLGDIPALEAQIAAYKPVLVVIDSLSTHRPAKFDLNSHGDVAPVLAQLRKVATAHNCAIVVIHHTNKAQTTDPQAKISGSVGIVATARHVILIAADPDDPDARIAAVAKSNLVAPNVENHKFKLCPFAWTGTTTTSAEDLLSDGTSGSAESSISEAERFIRTVLEKGAEDAARVASMAEAGLGIHRRTLQRAAKRIGVVAEYSQFGRGGMKWKLPSVSDSEQEKADKTDENEDLVTNGERSIAQAHTDSTEPLATKATEGQDIGVHDAVANVANDLFEGEL